MKRWMNKRAQFFLIAALIISGIILTFGKSYTTSKIDETPVEVYDLSDQLQYEASQVIDNGLLQGDSQPQIEQSLTNLTQYYASMNPDSDIDIIYGNESALKVIKWPVLGIFGEKDTSITVDSVKKFQKMLNNLGIENEIHIYPNVGHAFANPSGMNYAPEETKDAWKHTMEFLNNHLKK